MNQILVAFFAFNEGGKIRRTIERFRSLDGYDLLVMDDGSTDGSIEAIDVPGVAVLRNDGNRGAGYSVRRVLLHAREKGYLAVCLVAGNDKDRPEDIGPLTRPVLDGTADFVQGSRYAPGGRFGNMPLHRRLATQLLHPMLVRLLTGRRLTDTTNGFRAVRLAILDDARIDLGQSWLDRYELEPYLLYKVLTLGYRVCEVPVTKIYPPHAEGYSKIRPFSGWWSILRPFVYLSLGIRR